MSQKTVHANPNKSRTPRHRAREFALQGLYQWLMNSEDAGAIDAHIRQAHGFDKADSEHFDALLHGEFTRLFAELKREEEARAVLLVGRGRAFCAGGDFAWFPTLDDLAKLEHLRRDARQMIWDLLDVELPIVAAVNGPAVGLGASLALLCDVILMADTATIADPRTRSPGTTGPRTTRAR